MKASVYLSAILAMAGLVGFSSVALADPVAECQVVTSNQIETGQCLEDTLGAAQSVMEIALQRAQTSADSIDQVTGRPGARQSLDRAQDTWIQFREMNCAVPGAFAAGGSGSGQFIVGCQVEMTRARTVALTELASRR
jgi:uncharacterized protein YecT (DUF1311 family)